MIVRPCDREPITGQPLICSECGGDVTHKGYCFQDEEAPDCPEGNAHLDYNNRVAVERIDALLDATTERMR